MKKASKGSGGKSSASRPGMANYPQRPKPAAKKKKSAAKATPRRSPNRGAAKGKRKSQRNSGIWAPIVNWGGAVALWGLLLGGLFLGYFAYTLPDISGIGVIEKRPSMVLQTADGIRYSTYGDLYGDMLPIEEIPENIKQAVLATEDSHFYDHFGLNPVSLVRAAWRNYEAGRVVQGGSTITQQLAKNLFLTPERTLGRKIRETLLAFWLEAEYSKDEILALYLNRVYFGSGTYGIDAATRKYFSKPAPEMTMAEAAMLAGLLKAPSYYAPTRNLERAQDRASVVLNRMVVEDYLTASEAEKIRANPAILVNASGDFRNVRYFADWVVSEVQAYIGRTGKDLVITTTLDLDMQADAEKAIEARLKAEGTAMDVSQGAFVAMSPTGAVKAMIGGRSYSESVFNRATVARRQPGSVFKTVVYLAGFENGLAPDDIFNDGPINIDGWTPNNYTNKYNGAMSLREAFARSINTVAVKVTEQVGRDKVSGMAKNLGLTGNFPLHPSISLGTYEVSLLEMTAAHAVIANGGTAVLPYGVLQIREKDGPVLYQRQTSGQGRIISAATINKMQDVMSATIQWGTGKAANPGFAAAGKTGTTQDYRDAWFIGFTPDLVAGVWFGNDDGSATKRVNGSNLPAITWKDFITHSETAHAVAFNQLKEETSTDSIWDRIVSAFSNRNTVTQSNGEPSSEDLKIPGKKDSFDYLEKERQMP
ncbi:PBP1A family penicillin-binding protein [uncultured Sneathiella sp.]|jgi:penicillin-binding protein 1A|uniref:transglycosylase domain-containing protein n=1 Tax=uncultured Sneathiella sp. TaxID=879315 RepID=UPI0030D72523|tara:strand:- start:8407 stop:10527 length:2121 start_codon:yes stop_codon:yes gene_type:complete